MVITVDDDPVSLVELLWIRDDWGLQLHHDDVPPPLVDLPSLQINEDEAVDIRAWRAAWPELWKAAVRHAGEVRDPALFDAVHSTANNSTGPSWRSRFR